MNELRQLSENPHAWKILAVMLVILGAWTVEHGGLVYLCTGGVLLFCSGMLQDIHDLKDRLTNMERDMIVPLRKQIEAYEQRLETLKQLSPYSGALINLARIMPREVVPESWSTPATEGQVDEEVDKG